MNHVRKQKRPLQDIGSVAVELRRLAADHIEFGRQLTLIADRIERRDWNGIGEARQLGEVAESIIAKIVAGKGEYDR